jgi:hypothetical protein
MCAFRCTHHTSGCTMYTTPGTCTLDTTSDTCSMYTTSMAHAACTPQVSHVQQAAHRAFPDQGRVNPGMPRAPPAALVGRALAGRLALRKQPVAVSRRDRMAARYKASWISSVACGVYGVRIIRICVGFCRRDRDVTASSQMIHTDHLSRRWDSEI